MYSSPISLACSWRTERRLFTIEAERHMPRMIYKLVNRRPKNVLGTISPYPTVANVVIAKKKELKAEKEFER